MKTPKIPCNSCNKPSHCTKLRMTWNDPKRTYLSSNRKIIHSNYYYLCKPCLKQTITI